MKRLLIYFFHNTICIKIGLESSFKNRNETLITNTGVDHEVLEKAEAAIYHELDFQIR